MKLVYIFLIALFMSGCAPLMTKQYNPRTGKCEVVTNTSRFAKGATGTAIGAATGAATGAIAGKSPGKGAAIGALAGVAVSMLSEIFDSQTGFGSPECQDQEAVIEQQQFVAVDVCAAVRDAAKKAALTQSSAKKIRGAVAVADTEYAVCQSGSTSYYQQQRQQVVPNRFSVCTGQLYSNRAQAVQAENICRARGAARTGNSYQGLGY